MSCITRSVTMSTLESFQILSERYLESWILCFRTFPDYNYVSSTVKRLYETSRFPKTSIQVLLHQECTQRTSIYLDCLGKYHPTRQISLCGVIPHDCTVHSRSLSIFLSANSRRCPRWMIFSAFLKPYLVYRFYILDKWDRCFHKEDLSFQGMVYSYLTCVLVFERGPMNLQTRVLECVTIPPFVKILFAIPRSYKDIHASLPSFLACDKVNDINVSAHTRNAAVRLHTWKSQLTIQVNCTRITSALAQFLDFQYVPFLFIVVSRNPENNFEVHLISEVNEISPLDIC